MFAYFKTAAHPAVATLLLDPRPAWVWSQSGEQILWTNESGLAFLGEDNLERLLARRFPLSNSVRPHIARIGRNARPNVPILERLRFFIGVKSINVTCLAKLITTDMDAVLLIANDAKVKIRKRRKRAERLAKLLAGDHGLAAILDPDGPVIGASGGFDRLAEQSGQVDGVIDTAMNQGLANRVLDLPDGPREATALSVAEEGEPDLIYFHVGPIDTTLVLPAPDETRSDDIKDADTSRVRTADDRTHDSDTDIHEVIQYPNNPSGSMKQGTADKPMPLRLVDNLAFSIGSLKSDSKTSSSDADLSNLSDNLNEEDILELVTDQDAMPDLFDLSGSDTNGEREEPEKAPGEDMVQGSPASNQDEDLSDEPDVTSGEDWQDQAFLEDQSLLNGPSSERRPDDQQTFQFNAETPVVRFVWEMNAETVFTFVSDDFVSMLGFDVAHVTGRNWADVQTRLSLDPDNQIAPLLTRRDTWSGVTVNWPVQNHALRVPVDLAALPVHDGKSFSGFRGFGVCHPGDAFEAEDALGLNLDGIPPLPIVVPSVPVISDEARDAEAGLEHPHDTINDNVMPSVSADTPDDGPDITTSPIENGPVENGHVDADRDYVETTEVNDSGCHDSGSPALDETTPSTLAPMPESGVPANLPSTDEAQEDEQPGDHQKAIDDKKSGDRSSDDERSEDVMAMAMIEGKSQKRYKRVRKPSPDIDQTMDTDQAATLESTTDQTVGTGQAETESKADVESETSTKPVDQIDIASDNLISSSQVSPSKQQDEVSLDPSPSDDGRTTSENDAGLSAETDGSDIVETSAQAEADLSDHSEKPTSTDLGTPDLLDLNEDTVSSIADQIEDKPGATNDLLTDEPDDTASSPKGAKKGSIAALVKAISARNKSEQPPAAAMPRQDETGALSPSEVANFRKIAEHLGPADVEASNDDVATGTQEPIITASDEDGDRDATATADMQSNMQTGDKEDPALDETSAQDDGPAPLDHDEIDADAVSADDTGEDVIGQDPVDHADTDNIVSEEVGESNALTGEKTNKPEDEQAVVSDTDQFEHGQLETDQPEAADHDETKPEELDPETADSDGVGIVSFEDARQSRQSRAKPDSPADGTIIARPVGTGLIDAAATALALLEDTHVLHANPAFLAFTGFATLDDLINAGGLDRLFPAFENAFAGTHSAPMPLEGVTASGDRLDVLAVMETVPPVTRDEPSEYLLLTLLPDTALDSEHPDHPDQELETILDTATDGVLVMSQEGNILRMNRSAEVLFGTDRSTALGRPFTEFLAEESHRDALDYLDGLSQNGVASVLNDGREVIGKVHGSGLIPLFMTLGRINSGDAPRFCAVLRDITQWKRAEEDLLNAKQHAEAASSQKSDFVAKISHEIRTPLNAIIGFSEVMMEERFGTVGNDRYKEYLRDIHVSGMHIMSLVNDLLDLSKIEAGKMDLAFESVNANDVIRDCVALMQPQANREQIIIRTSLPDSVPQVVADPKSLRQIILNLFSNAIRFTDAGGQVIVSTAYEETGEVSIRVRDTGVGMSERDLKTALEPFRQISTTARAGNDGTGLGLPLTKALTEANRAKFAINSEVNQGTLVKITFPNTRVLAE